MILNKGEQTKLYRLVDVIFINERTNHLKMAGQTDIFTHRGIRYGIDIKATDDSLTLKIRRIKD